MVAAQGWERRDLPLITYASIAARLNWGGVGILDAVVAGLVVRGVVLVGDTAAQVWAGCHGRERGIVTGARC